MTNEETKQPKDIITMMAEERQMVLDAVNASGLPAVISEYIVKEILEAIHMKAMEEYTNAEQNMEEK